MDLVQVEFGQRNLVLQNRQVGTILGRKRSACESAQALAKLRIELPLAVEGGGTEIVQQVIEILALVFMESGAGGGNG